MLLIFWQFTMMELLYKPSKKVTLTKLTHSGIVNTKTLQAFIVENI